ncbi:MAG: TrbG/VirB9 family P-type conjugative transfer protein [Bacillota bacterium]
MQIFKKPTLLYIFLLLTLSTTCFAGDAAYIASPAQATSKGAGDAYTYLDNGIYQINTKVGMVTDIALAPGEEVTYIGAGDTTRWTVDKAISGAGISKQWHLYIKPLQTGIQTNFIINTDKHVYQLIVTSSSTYTPIVSWIYPTEVRNMSVYKDNNAGQSISTSKGTAGVPVRNIVSYGYKISDGNYAWKPTVVFDDADKTYIKLGAGTASSEMPVLFIVNGDNELNLVNYRIGKQDGATFMIVDRLFNKAVLVVGKDNKITITKGK